MLNKINIILGATASGKTDYGVMLANKLNGEIINSDSMQIYKEIPILTAQPTEEEKKGVPHLNFGIVSCFAKFHVKKWLDLTYGAIADIRSRGKTPILVGGTGLYIKALIQGIAEVPELSIAFKREFHEEYSSKPVGDLYQTLQDLSPQSAAILKPNDHQRILRALEVLLGTGKPLEYWHAQPSSAAFVRDDFYLIWLKRSREETYCRINRRFSKMLEAGVLDEVRRLLDKEGVENMPKAIGLQEIIKYFHGDISLNEVVKATQQNSRNYAKRQMTWFRHQMEFDEVVDI